jgi:regulatory protein
VKAPLSLRGRAIALLAQREHSEIELRRKLLRWARASTAAAPGAAGAADQDAGAEADTDALAQAAAQNAATQVDELIAWLREHDYLSEARFVDSRVHARSARFGNLRIRQELAQHGLNLPADAAQALKDSELQRAAEVWRRKFGASSAAPATPAERARQARFLAARGFSGEVVTRVMRRTGRGDPEGND